MRSWGFDSPLAHDVSYGPKIRRQRRRRSLILWGLAAIAIAIGFGVARAAGESELTRRYLDVAVDVARNEQDTAQAFASMVENIDTLTAEEQAPGTTT